MPCSEAETKPRPTVCKHGLTLTIGQESRIEGNAVIITGHMRLCPRCLMESFVQSMAYSP